LICTPAGSAAANAILKNAIGAATDIKASDALVSELRGLAQAQPGQQIDYEQMLQVVWDDKYLQTPTGGVKPGRGNVMKYLFLGGCGAVCYSDSFEAQPTLFGVKRGSSSVRYSLFTNENVDMTRQLKLVPADMIKVVDSDMKMSIARHPKTLRPLDPWLSYLAVSQGKKCDNRPHDQVCARGTTRGYCLCPHSECARRERLKPLRLPRATPITFAFGAII